MIKSRLEEKIKESLQRSPSVALMEPRQVGKTTIALNIAESYSALYRDLEGRLNLEKVRDIITFHDSNFDKLIILDEIQWMPENFAPLRGIIFLIRLHLAKASLRFLYQH